MCKLADFFALHNGGCEALADDLDRSRAGWLTCLLEIMLRIGRDASPGQIREAVAGRTVFTLACSNRGFRSSSPKPTYAFRIAARSLVLYP